MEAWLEDYRFERTPDGLEHPDEYSDSSFLLRRVFSDSIETIIIAVVLFLVINTLTARIRVELRSMEPTLYDGDQVIVNKLTYKFSEMERGDIIVFSYPLNTDEDYIKRVIGLPGDTVSIQEHQVYVNGQLLYEPYISDPPIGGVEETFVEEGTIFVMGDNRNNSSDSRDWGLLSMEYILGKAVFVYWPLDHIRLIQEPDTLFASQ
jgi:signal peptidase I